MRKIRLMSKVISIVIVAVVCVACPVHAVTGKEQSSFDRVAPYINFPTTITNALKKPVDAALIYLEQTNVYSKVQYIYKKFRENGLYPGWFDEDNERIIQDGVPFRSGKYETAEVPPLLGMKYEKPFLTSSVFGESVDPAVWMRYKPQTGIFDTGAKLTVRELCGTDWYSGVSARYHVYRQEEFYGIGSRTSVDNDYTFKLEETAFDYILGMEDIVPNIHVEGGIGYSNINILNGHDRGDTHIRLYPDITGNTLEGIGGAELVTYGGSVIHDTRDNRLHPVSGSYNKLAFSMNHGLHEEYEKFKYMKIRCELTQYIPLHQYISVVPKVSNIVNDKVFVLRGVFERAHNFDGKEIPFFDLPCLDSRLVRGYEQNRFFDKNVLAFSVAYRYTVWKWKDYKMNTSLFYDCGFTADKPSELYLKDMKQSAGVGLHFIFPSANTVAFEVARSPEGYRALLTWKPKF